MQIEKIFSESRMQETREIYDLWWEQKLGRPVAGMRVKCKTPDIKAPKYPLITQANCNNFDVSVDDILDAIEYDALSYEYCGDAYPYFSLDCFGPGITAALLGAELDNSTGHVWFKPQQILEPTELNLSLDEDNIWFLRLKQIMLKAAERFEGKILLSLPDLSGVMDILQVFRPGENLLFDLYDYPDEVIALNKQIYENWVVVYKKFAQYLNMDKFGYTDWSTLLSTKSSYVIQEDFSYMIGEDMFMQFVYENLEKKCDVIDRTLYHMDGPGEIKHLDNLLTLKNLNAVQWVSGDGNPTCDNYPEIYEKIEKAGKNIQIPSQGLDIMLKVSDRLMHKDRLNHIMITCTDEQKEHNLSLLSKLKII